jgi:putative spermidine/putrescine transport system permease protein
VTRRLQLVAPALVVAPVVIGALYVIAGALGLAGAGATGFRLDRIVRVLAERVVWEGLGWTLWVSAASTLLAAAAGVAIALVFRGARPVDRAGRFLAALPLPVPHLVAALLGGLVLAQSGLLARIAFALGLIDGPGAMPVLVNDRLGLGMILTLAWKETPFLALVAGSVLATRGGGLEEAARTLGASPTAALRHVTLPLLWRGLLPSVVAVAIFVAGSFEVAALLAPSDPLALPLLTWERYTDADLARRGDAFVLMLLAMALALAAVIAHEWMRARAAGHRT